MKQLQNIIYMLLFLPICFFIGAVTWVLSILRFKDVLQQYHRMTKIRKRVLYLEAFFPENSGYHYRCFKWAEIFSQQGVRADIRWVWDREPFGQLLANGCIVSFQSKFLFFRLWDCLLSLRYNCVIVRREILLFNDYGNLFLEKFLLALHPNVILDFDDDISAAKNEPREIRWFGRLMLESSTKFLNSLQLYPRFIVGSEYLKQYVLERKNHVSNDDILVIPTAVDYERYLPKSYSNTEDIISFGWVGGNHNLYLLDIVIPALNQVAKRHKIRLIVIAGKDYCPTADFPIVNLPWSLEKEIDNLRQIDIGLMPLHDTPTARGKCAFKLIQYMGLGIVSIASAITINTEIIDDGVNGFLVHTSDGWEDVIECALQRHGEFQTIGDAARKTIKKKYSFQANKEKYISFIGT